MTLAQTAELEAARAVDFAVNPLGVAGKLAAMKYGPAGEQIILREAHKAGQAFGQGAKESSGIGGVVILGGILGGVLLLTLGLRER